MGISRASSGNGLTEGPSRAAALAAALAIFAVSVAASSVIPLLLPLAGLPDPAQHWSRVLFSVTLMGVFEGGLVLVYGARLGALNRFRVKGPWLRGIAVGIPLGFALQLATVVAFLLVEMLVPDFSPEEVMGPIERGFAEMPPAVRAGLFVPVVIVAPLAEELLFRGLLLYGFEVPKKRWGSAVAALLSSLAFAAAHLNFWGFFAFAGFGLVLAWLTLRSGTISYALGAHVGYNLTALGALYLQLSPR